MSSKEEILLDHEGYEIARRFKVEYWLDRRRTNPALTRGFPKTDDGCIRAASKVIMRGLATKIIVTDRTTNKIAWGLLRGDRLPRTNVYGVVPFKKDPDAEVRRGKPNNRREGNPK